MTHLAVGTTLQGGRYRIVRFIRSGGFGCTYEAEHTQFQSRVALKEFFPKNYCNRNERTGEISIGTQGNAELVATFRRKFLDEARIIFKMHHSHIVRVVDIFEENGTAYYAMDYIEGQSLADVVKHRGRLPESEAVKYILHVADALKYVHSQNRLHLDVKPGNIMLDKSGKAILIDFGTCKHYDGKTGEETSKLMGVNTPGYAPVELMTASFKHFSPATDIYSLGATLYKLLTGITPPSSTDLMYEEETLPPLPTSISAPVRNAVSDAMQLKRKDRPQSINEWVAMFSSSASTQEESDETKLDEVEVVGFELPSGKEELQNEPPKPAPPKSNKKLRWTVGVAVAVVIAVIVGIVMYNKYSYKNIATGTINGHEYVDLGLSVKWATCNVGASSPYESGNYFTWGETEIRWKYDEENSKTYGKSMGSIAGNSQYDVARANWGSTWRLPTASEIDELINKCTWTWTSQGGHNGYKVKGPNGNSIFLPAAGWRDGTSLVDAGEDGYYWSATPREDDTGDAYGLGFYSGSRCRYWSGRTAGRSVRPVSE